MINNQGPWQEYRPRRAKEHGIIPHESYVLPVGCAMPDEYELCGVDVVKQSGLAHMSRQRKYKIVAVVYRN